jgi:(2R)-sulfolactate sulfo-lyase subunit alpha
MDYDRQVGVDVLEQVPLGYKVALADLGDGEEVIEYRVRVGLARRAIRSGELVHVHNLRSARWQKSE